MYTPKRKNLFLVVSFYYAAIVILLFLIGKYLPTWLPYFPFGGISVLEQTSHGNFVADVVEEVITTTSNSQIQLFDDSIKLLSTMLGAILIMLPVRWVYMGVGLTMGYNHAVAASLLILPLIVTGIVLIVQHSLALAFALAGIVAGVRYRTTLKNTSDALFVFAAIGVGLAAGSYALDVALVMSLLFCYTVLAVPPITVRAEDSPESPWEVVKPPSKNKSKKMNQRKENANSVRGNDSVKNRPLDEESNPIEEEGSVSNNKEESIKPNE